MVQKIARLLGLTLIALAGGCAAAPHDSIMQGNADGVVINYAGDLSATVPLARQYCARYERVPVFAKTQAENVYYMCLKPGEGPPGQKS